MSRVSSTQKAYLPMSRRISGIKMRAYGTLGIVTSSYYESSHQAHQHWVRKVEHLWTKLTKLRWTEAQSIMDEIRRNKAQIQSLSLDNLFELDVNFHDQKMLLKTRRRHKKVQNKVQKSK